MADMAIAGPSGSEPQRETLVAAERGSGMNGKPHDHSGKKGKLPAKSTSSPRKVKSVILKCDNKSAGSARPTSSASKHDAFEDKILSAISALNAKMDKQDQQMQVVASRLDQYDEYWAHEGEAEDFNGGPANVSAESPNRFVGFPAGDSGQECEDGEIASDQRAEKRGFQCVDQDDKDNSMFKRLGRKFITAEVCDSVIDQDLADNVNYLFKNGIEEERYKCLVKDEENPRPANCDSLVVVKINQLIWEAVTPAGRTRDMKMQNMEASIIKAATILAKTINVMGKVASTEGVIDNVMLGKILEDSNDILALLGHTNRQINMARKDFLRKEINSEYSHLCNHNVLVTKFLFGDDVSQSAKEIEDCSKLSNKMFQARPVRGVQRFRPGRMARFRSAYPYGRGRARSQGFGGYGTPGPSTAGTSVDTKNVHRRGSRPYRY